MANRLDIINLALSRINAGRLVSLDEESKPARVAKVAWDTALDATLRTHDWGFAARSEYLALLSDQPVGHASAYAIPPDYVIIRRVRAAAMPAAGESEPYRIQNIGGRIAIVCDVEKAVADYTARIDNCALFDPQFADALAWRLAGDFALALKADVEMVSATVQLQDRAKAEAMTANAQESGFTDDPISSFERARWR